MSHPAKADVARALRDLKRHGDPRRAAGAAAYFKAYEKLTFFGVDSPTVRRMAADLAREHREEWTWRDAIAFAEGMLAVPQLEAKGLGLCVAGRYRQELPPAVLPTTRRWLTKYCLDWATTDTLCGEVIAPLLGRYPDLVPRVRAWRTSPHLYVRRASAVALVPLARRGEALGEAYEAALALGGESHHLLQKAAGWLAREAGRTDMPRLATFLRRHGQHLSRTTVSYAIERFPPAQRAALLAATRPSRRRAD